MVHLLALEFQVEHLPAHLKHLNFAMAESATLVKALRRQLPSSITRLHQQLLVLIHAISA
jgi:hypothetical protein